MATLRIRDKKSSLGIEVLHLFAALPTCVSAGWHTGMAEEAPAHSGAAERQSVGGQERWAGYEMLFQLFPNSLQSPGTVNYSISSYLSRASGG